MKKLRFLLTASMLGLLVACGSTAKSNESVDPSSNEASSGQVSSSAAESSDASSAGSSAVSSSAANTSSSQALPPIMTIDYASKKADYQATTFAVSTTVENGYTLANGVCTITVAGTYTVSGYLKGQILVTVAGVELEVNNAYLENDQGKAPIYCNVALTDAAIAEKLEVKGKGTSYIVQYGGTYNKNNKDTAGAIVSECNLDLGGKGAMYIVGSLKHGVKASKVTVKSEGTRFVQGTKDGSAINCSTFVDKTGSNSVNYVINSKNGIKADNALEITSEGTTIHMYDCETGIKTEKTGTEEHITLGEGTIVFYDHVTTPFDTNEGGLTNNATINPTVA